jgi:hypothetical protein
MPLSNDFDKSRLEFLKKQIKNNKTVAAQFYPRYQREYNEMFPFTEGSVQNVLQPQQQIVSDAALAPNMELIKDNLQEELNSLTKNETLSDFIINSLSEAEQYYYSKNFNLINKELLKKIKMPVSKQEFVITLNTIFNSDKHKNDIAAIGLFSIPPSLAPPVLPLPVVPAPPGPAPGPLPVPRIPTRNTLIIPQNFQVLIDDLGILKNQTNQTANVLAKITQTEDQLADLANSENIDKTLLARYLYGKPRAKIPQDLLDSVEEWLLRAEIRDQAALAAAATQPTQNNPNKTINYL